MDIQNSIYKRRPPIRLFRNRKTFLIAIALTAFNCIVVGALAVLMQLYALPLPGAQTAAVGPADIARVISMSGLWSIGNTVLVLALIDAGREPEDQREAD